MWCAGSAITTSRNASYNPGVMPMGCFLQALMMPIKRKLFVLLLLFCSATVFVLRGPFRALRNSGLNDVLSPYIQSEAWVHGADPYSPQSLLKYWPEGAEAARPESQEMQDGSVLFRHGIPTAYPPTSLVLLAPFTAISWPIFKLLWVGASVSFFRNRTNNLRPIRCVQPYITRPQMTPRLGY